MQMEAAFKVPPISPSLWEASKIPAGPGTDSKAGFGAMLGEAIQNANELQSRSEELMSMFALGETDDLLAVSLAQSKAKISLNFIIEIRNKVLEAYQEIMRMAI